MKNTLLLLLFIFVLPLQAQRIDFKDIDFDIADRIASRHKGEELLNVPALVHKLTAPFTTDITKFRALYYWVTHNISGDYVMMDTNERMRKEHKNDTVALQAWNRRLKINVFKNLRINNQSICTGYAYLLKVMCKIAEIDCVIINGYGDTERKIDITTTAVNHSWNAVRLNGKWYLCDATWAAGYTDMSTMQFIFDYDDSYFLVEPVEFAQTHRPSDKKWFLIKRPYRSK